MKERRKEEKKRDREAKRRKNPWGQEIEILHNYLEYFQII